MPIYPSKEDKHKASWNKDKPGGLQGTEMTRDVVLWVPDRSWSFVSAPDSQTYTKKEHIEKNGI